jgi:hypothetical protein
LNTTPTAALNLPISLLVCPGRQLLVPSPFPVAPVTFVGWGGIRGKEDWPDHQDDYSRMTREVLRGVANTAPMKDGHKRVVVDCEKRTGWLKGHPERATAIDNLLVAIYHGMKAVHGPSVEVGYCGPEDAIVGDFTTPMLSDKTTWNTEWYRRMPLPFISPRYGGTTTWIAWALKHISDVVGLSRGVVLWLQETDPAAQQGVIDFGLAVDKEYGRIR